MGIEQAFELFSLMAITFGAYQTYAGLSFGLFRVHGMTRFITSLCGALIIIWLAVRYAQVILTWLGFGFTGYSRYAVDLAMMFVVLAFGCWIALTRAKSSPKAIIDVFIVPILAGAGFESLAQSGFIKIGFVEAIRLIGPHL